MLRMFKLAALVAGVLGLVATSAPPAHADTYGIAVFQGTAALGGPLGYPGVGTVVPPTTLPGPNVPPELHCSLPLPTSGTLLTIAGQSVPDPSGGSRCHVDFGGHTRSVSFGAATCVTADVNVNKLAKPIAHVNPGCTISTLANTLPEGNHVHGYCGLSGGQVMVRFTDGLGQVYDFDVHFTGIGSVLVVTGHWIKRTNTVGQTGKVVSVVVAVPVPGTTTTPPGTTNSCLGNSASVFTIVGGAVIYPHPITIP